MSMATWPRSNASRDPVVEPRELSLPSHSSSGRSCVRAPLSPPTCATSSPARRHRRGAQSSVPPLRPSVDMRHACGDGRFRPARVRRRRPRRRRHPAASAMIGTSAVSTDAISVPVASATRPVSVVNSIALQESDQPAPSRLAHARARRSAHRAARCRRASPAASTCAPGRRNSAATRAASAA